MQPILIRNKRPVCIFKTGKNNAPSMLQKMFRGGTKRDENRFKNSTPSNEYDVNSTNLIVHRLNASWRIGCNAALFRKKKRKKSLKWIA